MRRLKHLMMAAFIAAGTLAGTAAPLAAAEFAVTEEAAAALPDGTYWVRDSNGNIVGYIIVRNGRVVGGETW